MLRLRSIAYLRLTTKGKADCWLSFAELQGLPIEDASELSQLDGASAACNGFTPGTASRSAG